MASGESVWGESESFAANSDLDKKVKVKKNLKQSPLNKPPKMLKQKRKQMNDEAVQIRKYMKFLGVLIIILIILGASIGYFYFNLFNSNSDHSDKVLNDSDGDGLEDSWELEHNLDPKNSDTDYDGMPDGWEVDYSLNPLFNDSGEDQDQDGYDMDNNGQIDYKERFTNLEEFLWKTNPREKDSDGDVMWDGWEVLFWERIEQYKHKNWLSDQPSRLDPTDPADANDDLDFVAKTSEGNIIGYILKPDKLLNREEFLNGTDPTKPDTDEDDLTDYQEVLKYNTDPLDIDSDHDNLWDGWEIRYGGWGVGLDPNDKDSDNDGILDSLEDLDNDTLWNLQELFMGTSPVSKDTDSDSLPDNWESEYWITEYIFSANPKIPDSEIDYDKDGLTNELEYIWNTSPSDIDTDDDGLEDGVEVLIYGTNPINNDTDTDGIKDKEEVLEGSDGYITNATNSDTDGDGISDLEEIINGLDKFITNPTKKDSDNDWLTDKEEIDAYWGWGKNRGYKTIPTVNDSDGDGLLDGEEVKTDFHPFIDFDTTIYNCIDTGPIDGTNATNPDTDGDGIPDGWEARFGNISRHGYIRYIKDFDLNYGYQRYGFNYLDKLNENPQVLFI